MRLLIVRHGDPDYIRDSLTPAGWKEADLLAERLAGMQIDEFYVSPLGRAQDTASRTLELTGRTAETLEWLKEFPVRIRRPDRPLIRSCAWDWLPEDWTSYPGFYRYESWFDHPVMQEAGVKEEYLRICSEFSSFLEEHGYQGSGNVWKVTESSHKTICLFCHFGLECVLLSHLLKISPMILWHGAVAAPSSVTVVHTEERQKGTAFFRIAAFGDTSHLYAGGREPSFAARYAECFADLKKH